MSNTDNVGKLTLRVVLAILILFHGVSKLINGPGFVTAQVAQFGLPPALGYLVYIGEVVAPVLLLVGVWSRIAAAIIAINMIVAFLLVHTSQFFSLSKTGGWALELQAMYLFSAIVLVFLGAGRYSLGGTSGRWN
jgi:putative oxidoreductase